MIPAPELRAYVRAASTDDPLLEQLERGAVAFVEEQTSWYFGEPAQTVEILSGAGDEVLYLRQPPVASPAPVLEYFDGTAWTVVATSDYTIADALLWKAGFWTQGSRNYRATYTRGYTAGDEPQDIRLAVMQLVAYWYEYRLPIEPTTINELPMSVKGIISSWRRVRV